MRRRQARKNFVKKKLFTRKTLFRIALVGLGFLAVIFILTFVLFFKDLNSKESIMNRNNTGVTLLDKNEKPFFTFFDAKVTDYIEIDKIPQTTKDALISAEDKNFYEHKGVSFKAILGALWADIRSQELAYGGSTITQQMVKNTLLTNEKTFLRKFQELILSAEIERRYTKDEILEMYLNSVYFGEGAFGIKAAAKTYFNKNVNDLTLKESALLIGILPAPSAYSPATGNLDSATERRDYVIEQMLEEGHITQAQADAATKDKVKPVKITASSNLKAPHFALMVKDQLIEEYGEEKIARSGFKVKTGLNLKWQEKAETALKNRVDALVYNNASNGAVVVQDPKSGEVRALVGSRGWSTPGFGTVNMANTPRQTGSSFKPIYFATGIDQEIVTAATILHDKPTDFGGYKPENYDRGYRGDVTVRRALANSLNIPAVELMEKVGVSNSIRTAKSFGIKTLDDSGDYGLSLALGTGEVPLIQMVGAYSTFARGGLQRDPILISSIENKDGQEVEVRNEGETRVMDEQTPFIISSILSDQNTRSEIFGSLLNTTFPAAVKTGSTENYRDSWTVGYTDDLTIGVWVGNNDNQAMNGVAGSVGAAPVWRELMTEFDKGETQFEPPSGIVQKQICATGIGRGSTQEYFIAGTEPSENCKPVEKPKKQEKKKDKQEELEVEEEPVEEEPTEEIPEEPVDPDNPTDPTPPGNTGNNGNNNGRNNA